MSARINDLTKTRAVRLLRGFSRQAQQAVLQADLWRQQLEALNAEVDKTERILQGTANFFQGIGGKADASMDFGAACREAAELNDIIEMEQRRDKLQAKKKQGLSCGVYIFHP